MKINDIEVYNNGRIEIEDKYVKLSRRELERLYVWVRDLMNEE